jgi:hypothetical protein
MPANNSALIANFINYLDRPLYKIVFSLTVGIFLSAFLIAFLPFGVSNYQANFHLTWVFVFYISGAGVLTSFALCLSELILRPLLLHKPNIKMLILWLIWDYWLVTSLTFIYYNFIGDWHDFSWSSYLHFIPEIAMVITFPVGGYLFYIRYLALNQHAFELSKQSSTLPAQEMICFESDNNKETIVIPLKNLYYLQSQDNYTDIVFCREGLRQHQLIRSSLTRFNKMHGRHLHRCHRSFAVNLSQVIHCSGNQHGLSLTLMNLPEKIPVSRSYVKSVLAALNSSQKSF